MDVAPRVETRTRTSTSNTHCHQKRCHPRRQTRQAIRFAGMALIALTVPVVGASPPGGDATHGFYGGLQTGPGMLGTGVSGPRGSGGSLSAEFGDMNWGTGAFLGYAWTRNRWLFALETELDEGSGDWSHDQAPGGRQFSVERGTSVAGSARLGHWVNRSSLVYGRVGISRTEFNSEYDDAQGLIVEQDDWENGVRLGVGAELGLGGGWFGRMDWSHTRSRAYAVSYTDATDRFSPEETTLRLGIGYRFHDLDKGDARRADPAAFDGPYAGIRLGHGWLHTENTGDSRGQAQARTLSADRAGDGLQAGVFLGYGLRLHATYPVYLGLELEADATRADWQSERTPRQRIYSVDRGTAYAVSLRLGYVVNDALLYARVGHVRSRFNTRYEFENEGVSLRDKRTLSGLRAGIGVELPATDQLFVQLDYSYTDYDSYRLRYPMSDGEATGTEKFDNDEAAFNVGLGYRF